MPSQTFFNLPKEKQDRIMEAAIKEMGLHTYEHLNLANIIRDAQIPRGSFYQYFKNKSDIYDHFYSYIAQLKYIYYNDLFSLDKDMPFLERFYQIYIRGYTFMLENPQLVKAGQKVIISDHYQQSPTVKKGSAQGIELFASFIIKDQALGRIRKNIDPVFLATFLLEFMGKVTLEEYFKDEINIHKIEIKIQEMIDILKKGIT